MSWGSGEEPVLKSLPMMLDARVKLSSMTSITWLCSRSFSIRELDMVTVDPEVEGELLV